jgi:hypothetical protein
MESILGKDGKFKREKKNFFVIFLLSTKNLKIKIKNGVIVSFIFFVAHFLLLLNLKNIYNNNLLGFPFCFGLF